MDVDTIDSWDDIALAKASRAGNVVAFECLVRRHQRMLLNVAFRMTNVYEDSCDIVQDAFISAWRKLSDYRGEAKFSTWMTAIVMNLSRNRLQQLQLQAKRVAFSLNAPFPEGNEMMPELPSGAQSVLSRMEEAELRQTLRRCIDALTPEFREVIVLRDMQEMSYEDVGEVLKVRAGTVKSRLSRARDAVKDCIRKRLGQL